MLVKKHQKWLFFSLTILTIAAMLFNITCDWSHSINGFQHIYSSNDLLQVPMIVNDLIYQHGKIMDWYFSQMPYFFPDIAISALIGFFTQNVIFNILIYALLQTIFLLFILVVFIKMLTGQISGARLAFLFTLVVFLTSKELVRAHQSSELLAAMLMSSQHFGVTIIAMTCLYLFTRFMLEKKLYLLILFYILGVLAIGSDVLTQFYLIAPLSLTLSIGCLLNYIKKYNYLKLMAIICLTSLSGYLVFQYSPLHYARPPIALHFHWRDIYFFLIVMGHFFREFFPTACFWLVFVLVAPFSLWSAYKNRKILPDQQTQWINFIILLALVTVVWTIPAFIITDNNLDWATPTGYTGLRHLQPFIIYPVFLGLPLLLYKHTPIPQWLTNPLKYGFSLGIIILICLIIRPPLNQANLLSYYPPEIACFDQHAKKLNLHAGVGYWPITKAFTLFNHSGVRVVQVSDNPDELFPILSIISVNAYKGDQFDFIVAKSPHFAYDQRKLLHRFGKPTADFTCPGGFEFYAYTNKAMRGMFTPFERSNFDPKMLIPANS